MDCESRASGTEQPALGGHSRPLLPSSHESQYDQLAFWQCHNLTVSFVGQCDQQHQRARSPGITQFTCVAGHRMLLHYLECADHPLHGVPVPSAEECSAHLNLLSVLVELLTGTASSVNLTVLDQ